LTIIQGTPYDRERTTMAPFALCPECREEYDDPGNRRFHAQPTACPQCGPQLLIRDRRGRLLAVDNPVAYTASALREGLIGALKGIGGYHLACLAEDEGAVAELRQRKHRDEKPFAVMIADLEGARTLCEVSSDEEALLRSSRRPIVLLRRRHGIRISNQVAPRNPLLGLMLPYSPLHHLLMEALKGAPVVLTSGNQSDEPIAYRDEDALARLSGIADFFLVHDRPIQLRCDDSVTRVVAGIELPIRRSRGDAPQSIALPVACPQPTLALGGQLKAVFALGRGRHAFLSHHLGDLDHFEAYRAYVEAIAHYERLFDFRAVQIVHDLHPDYASTRYAREQAGTRRTIAVQHHHAHLASCMAENGLDEPVIGVTFDGTGFGTDGTIWGGEFLLGDYRSFRRAAHLRPVAMPGGEQAIREPWRMAASYLIDAGEGLSTLAEHVPSRALATIERMIERRFNAPITTSAGRLFDAVAALAGVRPRVSFEGQAAMELEWLASEQAPEGVYPFAIAEMAETEALAIDVRPMIREIVADLRQGLAPAVIGRQFHTTMVEIIARVCDRLRGANGLDAVVLSGGVFLNALLTREVTERLSLEGFRVYRHRRVPPNDGGLSLGQLAIAAAQGTTGGVADVSWNPGESG
jgi:hydrogenase maturation protein HypF